MYGGAPARAWMAIWRIAQILLVLNWNGLLWRARPRVSADRFAGPVGELTRIVRENRLRLVLTGGLDGCFRSRGKHFLFGAIKRSTGSSTVRTGAMGRHLT